MFRKLIYLPVALAAAGGIPFVAMNKDLSKTVSNVVSNLTGGQAPAENTTTASFSTPALENSPSVQAILNSPEVKAIADAAKDATANVSSSTSPSPSPSLATGPTNPPSIPNAVPGSSGPAVNPFQNISDRLPFQAVTEVYDLREIFRFDITPNWIKSRWPRVSTGWTEDGLEGYRVALVTGTTPADIHGSLTYYFDDHHRVQRICFSGRSGDATRLVQLATQYHEFRSQPTHNAGLYIRKYRGNPTGALRLIHEAVIRAENQNSQLHVMFEINNTQGSFELSKRFQAILENDRLAGRW